ncbi:dTDP-glucose 4,6-dehydratase [Fictibacillus sp. 23RED33]|uniref:dTDP-glucose 4,6-dehydratase n=1 Tax=Fictibacillus sp. 23RED33 TaxID=2745879 RepID=UPI0018CFA19B|nr:dTDP-glucose 4,6-dehydratase [Fictibacillus sp. 23RED33]MBH0173835.1 dTDP-glucose 4,6-dehydratase [Fictibacillus sp. 23RED33]
MNLLVTGGAGFIGSNFIKYILSKYEEKYNVVNYDLLTYAGNLNNLLTVKNLLNYKFVRGDINNQQLVDYVIKAYDIDVIVNFAAESHVDRSIENPGIFIKSNVQGVQTLLEAAKENKIRKFIQISTDEVYGSLDNEGYFTEETPLAPNSPYSSSKASADLIVRAYHETFGLDINITRCSNNYGPFQYTEKLIPKLISKALKNENIPIYGNGENIRDWLHVIDHCSAIDMVIHNGTSGSIYNIGGNNEKSNNEIAQIILKKLKVSQNLIKHVDDRLGHDFRYAVDSSKIQKELGWAASIDLERGLDDVISWYRCHL